MSSGSTASCPRCGAKHNDALLAAMCCLHAPEPQGYCHWCGDDCELSFCCKACAVEYDADVAATPLLSHVHRKALQQSSN